MGCGVSSDKSQMVQNPQGLYKQQNLTIASLYQRKQMIGKGTYGKVYRCINRQDGKQYALKVIQLTAKNKQQAIKDLKSIKSEISVLKRLNHNNIVKYYNFEVSPDQNCVQMVLQLVEGGTLKQYIQSHNSLSQTTASSFCKQIISGLQYLHYQNILHRDLKCANILLTKENVVKITDFGTAKIINRQAKDDIAKMSASLKGTPYYMAPQVIKRMGHTFSADIWSLGCTTIQMLSGKAPWTGLTTNFQEIIGYISSGIHPPYPPKISIQCQRFLDACLDPMASKRWSANKLSSHQFISRSKRKQSMNQNTPPSKVSKSQTPSQTIQIIQNREQPKLLLQQSSLNNPYTSTAFKKDNPKGIARPKRVSASNQKNSNYKSATSHKLPEDILNVMTSQTSSKLSKQSYPFKHESDNISKMIEQLDSDLGQNSFEGSVKLNESQSSQIVSNLYYIKKSQKRKRGEDDKLKVSKTDANVKMSQENIISLGLEEYRMNKRQSNMEVQIYESMNVRSNTQFSQNNEGAQFINTEIARAERNRYLESQKLLKQKKDQQKRKWERQLKEGAAMLKKQMSSRYVYSQL